LGGIDGITDQLAQKDLMVRVKEFLDDREDILGIDRDCTFFFGHGRGF
jgi:hypothetical protein